MATSRRAVAVEVGDGESVLIGPDNGLLAPAVALVGGASRAVSLTSTEYHLPAPGPTFAGRDLFAPVAAHLANGVELGEFGEEVDPSTLLPGVMPVAAVEDDGLHAEVLWVDRFGNVQLNVGPDELGDVVGQIGGRCQVRSAGTARPVVRVFAFDEVPAGGLGLLVDSYGLATLVVDRASAAVDLGVSAGDSLVLAPTGDDSDSVTRVELGRSEPV